MTAAAVSDRAGERGELAAAVAAVRSRVGLVVLLLALAGAAWWSTVDRMAGMDGGPGTDLGTLGWFLGVWVVMMAAMMFPSLAPTTALYARMTRQRGWSRPLLFTAAYLLVWGAAGLVAYGLFRLGRSVLGGDLAWRAGGRWFAGGVLAIAAIYELTPLKDVCLGKCRSPLGFLLGAWRDGNRGALEMGSKHAALVPGLLLGADGRTIRARSHEHHMDGVDRRADHVGEDDPVAPGSDLGHRSSAHRAGDHGYCDTQRRPRACDSERRATRHALDERNALIHAGRRALDPERWALSQAAPLSRLIRRMRRKEQS